MAALMPKFKEIVIYLMAGRATPHARTKQIAFGDGNRKGGSRNERGCFD
ncbi:MAG: hypothetical protein ABSA39_19830 [Edaphobacter sp.]